MLSLIFAISNILRSVAVEESSQSINTYVPYDWYYINCKNLLLLASSCVVVWFFWRGLYSVIRNGVYTRCRSTLSWFITRYDFETVRRSFRNTFRPIYRKVAVGNPHRELACFRDSATHQMDHFCEAIGFNAYHVSLATRYINTKPVYQDPSTKEWKQQRVFRGNRVPFHIADTGVTSKIDNLLPKDTLVFTDVDYYVDLNYYAAYMQPMMLYTFDPPEPAGVTNEMVWTIRDNQYFVKIHGGGEFVHNVWDHDHDIASFHYGFTTYNFKCDRIRYDDYHSVVFYTPLSSYYSVFDMFFPPTPVLHKQLTFGRVSGFYYHDTQSAQVVLKLCTSDSYTPYSMPSDDVAALKLKQIQLQRPDLATSQSHCEEEDRRVGGSLFHEFVRQPNSPRLCSRTIGYTALDSKTVIDKDRPEPAFFLHAPLDPNGAVPTNDASNDRRCIDKRITAVASDAEIPKSHKRFCREFAKRVFPNVITPVTSDFVHEQQSRPSQKVGYSQYEGRMHEDKYVVRSFQKGESYPEPKDPRNISTIPANIRHLYSQYTLAMAAQLKNHDWYAFGKTPKQIADKVHQLGQFPSLIPTDYSRFDGTHSPALIHLERCCLQAAFRGDTLAEVLKLFETQHDIRGVTKNGVKYDVGSSRLSGSPETSLFNTLCNAYIAYVCLRKNLQPDEAFAKLGLYGGDDGLSHSISLDVYERTASQYGLKLKAMSVETNRPIVFLGRLFPNCRLSNESLYEPARFLPRCHIGLNKLLTVEQNAVNRAYGYLLTDPTSPIVSNWCRYILRASSLPPMKWDKGNDPWFAQYSDDIQFPCVSNDNPDAIFAAAESLKVTPDVINIICQWLDDHNFKDGAEPPPWFTRKKPEFPCLIDGEIWSGPESQQNNKRLNNGKSKTKNSTGAKPK